MPINACSLPPTCKENSVFGGTWIPGAPRPKGTACTTNGMPNGPQGTCNGSGQCITAAAISERVAPRYEVVSVLYAPPGLDGGKSTSYVEYGSGSKAGSTVSSSKTFKNSLGVTVTAGVGAAGNGASVSVGYSNTNSTTNKSTVEITKSAQENLRVTGPAADGINHDQDQIWIWVNPSINVVKENSDISWNVDASNVITQYLGVGELKKWISDPSSVSTDDVGKELAAMGFETADYKTILSADVFAYGANAIDPKQFVQTSYNLPYEPPLAGAGSALKTVTISNEAKDTTEKDQSASTDLSVSMTTTFSGGFASGSVKIADEWTWTNENSSSSSADATQTATAAVGQPSATYMGPTNISLYWDSIWQTFLFVPTTLTGTPILSGTVMDASGRVIPFSAVSLEIGTLRLRTFTNQQGDYAFYETGLELANGETGNLNAVGLKKTVKISSLKTTKMDFKELKK